MSTFDRPPERPTMATGGLPGGPPARTPSIRPNKHTWRNAFGAAVPVYIVTLIVLLPAHTGSDSYEAGRLIWPATLGALVVGAMARDSSKVWHWWTYLGGVTGVAAFVVGLVVLVQALNADDEGSGGTGSEAVDQAAQGAGTTLWVPDRAGAWTLIDSGAARHREEEALSQLVPRFNDQFSAVYGEYRHGTVHVTFLGLNTKSGSGTRAEQEESPASAVRNYLAGAGATSPELVESGASNVAMACDEVGSVVVCGWADATAMGRADWVAHTLDIDQAASLTRKFREHVSRPNT